jgi:hypothetical protein
VPLLHGRFPSLLLRTRRAPHNAPGSPPAHTSEGFRPAGRQHGRNTQYPLSGAPIFTGDLLPWPSRAGGLAVPLRHVCGSPALGLLRGLRPLPGSISRRRALPSQALREAFPRSPSTDRRGRRPALPRQHRHEYTAEFLVASSSPDDREFRVARTRACAADRPTSARFEPAWKLRGVNTDSLAFHLLVSLDRPEPSGSTGPSRRCRGCSYPCLRLQVRAASSFTALLRQTGGADLPSALGCMAPRGAPIGFHRGPVRGEARETSASQGPCAALRNLCTPLTSEAPVSRTSARPG